MERKEKKILSIKAVYFYFSLLEINRGAEVSLTGSINCATRSVECCSKMERMF